MLAVRFHWPFSTFYDNQINYNFLYPRHDATWGLGGLKTPHFFRDKNFLTLFLIFEKNHYESMKYEINV